jgi:hypothetical protein
VALLYSDVLLVLIVAAPALAAGAPALGYTVGGAAWIVGRIVSAAAERRIAGITDIRRRLGFGVASAIIVVGLAGTRADGLTAALVIFGAFTAYFVRAAFGHWAQRRSAEAR